MSLLRDFIELITTQSGALVYHLVTLFAIQLIAGVAVGHWQRERDEPSTRMLVTGVGLFLARAALMLIAVFDGVGLVSLATVLPPLERFLQLVTSLLVIWAFLPALEGNPRLAGALLLIATLVATATYAALASLWAPAEARGLFYNSFWQAGVWDLSTVLILGLSLIATVVWRGPDWGWLFCLLALWVAGYALQLGSPSIDSHYPGWVQLANLAALPLLAGLMYRTALRPVTLQDRERAWEASRAWRVLEAVRLISTGSGLEPGLQLAATSTAQALKADMAAIGLLSGEPARELHILALHPTTGEVGHTAKRPILLLSDYAVLARASAGNAVRAGATTDEESRGVRNLYEDLGFADSGPLLVQPLDDEGQTIGLMLVGNPQSERHWASRDRERLEAVALAVGSAIGARQATRAESTD